MFSQHYFSEAGVSDLVGLDLYRRELKEIERRARWGAELEEALSQQKDHTERVSLGQLFRTLFSPFTTRRPAPSR